MIYAIGDIHGQQTMLAAMLDKLYSVPIKTDDTLVFLGDYIDRGENTCAVIETLLKLQRSHSHVVFLRGNHEQMLLSAHDSAKPALCEDPGCVLVSAETRLWLDNGGANALYSYKDDFDTMDLMRWWEVIPEAHWTFLQNTQLEYVTDHYCFVHAGLVPPGREWEGELLELDPRLWIREPFLSSYADFDGKTVVFGHTPQMNGQPLISENKIGLDTGAVFDNPLTAVALHEPPTRRSAPKVFQVEFALDESLAENVF